MDYKQASSSLDTLISSFTNHITELQQLVIARDMHPASNLPDLLAINNTVTAIESQVKAIKSHLQEERDAIPKAKKFIQLYEGQQRKLVHMLAHMPSGISFSASSTQNGLDDDCSFQQDDAREDTIAPPKDKKDRNVAPRWYVTDDELDSLSSYMRGRLTINKINIAINELAIYAEANFHLIVVPKAKLTKDTREKALELRDISNTDGVKGKHFVLETDIKGPGLKLDHTGKAILTVLRHLGRMQEARIGRYRVLILSKPSH